MVQHADGVRPAKRLAGAASPDAGAAVMASGVMSLCFVTTGALWLSWLLFAMAAIMWVVLLVVFLARARAELGRWLAKAAPPSTLTLVAGTAVLGGRLATAGRLGSAQGLLVISLMLWAVLLPLVLLNWSTPTVGASFLVCVASQALAVLAARLAQGTGQRWEMYGAAAAFVLGLVLYGVTVGRFDFRQLLLGKGDQWVFGGALAISALAGSTLLNASADLGAPEAVRTALVVLTSWLGCATGGAYVTLAAAELIRPRLRFDIRRWSTVFPLGMTALASLHMARVFHEGGLWDLGKVLAWLALTVWLAVAVGSLRRAGAIAAGRWRCG